MLDLATIFAIGGFALTGLGVAIAYVQLRRTPKPPKPPITGTSATILGVGMYADLPGLPGYHRR